MGKLSNIILFCTIIFAQSNKSSAQWNISGNLNAGYINAILVNDKEIYAGTSGQGIFRSDDNGLAWVQMNSGLGNFLLVQSLAAKDNYVFAGTSSGGIFYSDNKGANWIQSNQGISQLNIKDIITDNINVYAGCIFAGVFRSTNNGLNWSRFALGEGDLLHTMSYDQITYFIGLYGGIYRSTNSGVNWTLAHTGLTNLDIRTIVQISNKTYCGTFGGGVFVSENNGVLWTDESNGLLDQKIQVLAGHENLLFAGTNTKGIFYFNVYSGYWTEVNQGLKDTNIVSIAMNDKFIFAGSSTGKIWKRPLSEIITSINHNSSNLSEQFQLYQNYPNPFNPETVISFYLPVKSYVSLKIFDIAGREVEEIYSGVLQEGKFTKRWNALNQPAGIYYCRLQSGLDSETRKLVLIK